MYMCMLSIVICMYLLCVIVMNDMMICDRYVIDMLYIICIYYGIFYGIFYGILLVILFMIDLIICICVIFYIIDYMY